LACFHSFTETKLFVSSLLRSSIFHFGCHLGHFVLRAKAATAFSAS